MFALQNNIFNKFGPYYRLKDTYKDANGKGIAERFHEMLANDLDTNFTFIVANLVGNTINPKETNFDLLTFIRESLGNIIQVSEDEAVDRKTLSYTIFLYQVKGTLQALKTLFNLIGFPDVDFDGSGVNKSGFDSDLTFDSDERTFDSFKTSLKSYSLIVYGNQTLSPDLLATIYKIIKWNEPIIAFIKKITYWDIPAISGDLPSYNAMTTNSVFTLEGGKLTQTYT